MDKNLSLSSFKELGLKLASFLHRYGLLVFFLLIAAGLITCILLLNNVITQTDNPNGYVSDVNDVRFDTETINKLRELRSGNEDTKSIDTGDGRLLPF